MGNPVFRFTLTHATLGSMIISEPDGWKEAKLKFERHPDFHSLVEYFEGSFIFYGENNYDNGGADFIRQCENLFGFDAEIQILIEADIDGDGDYEETIFSGQLDLTGIQEVQDNKIEVPIIRNDFWAKFISRKETPVNLRSTTDLDGGTRSVIDLVDLQMTPQKLRKSFYAYLTYGVEYSHGDDFDANDYFQVGFDKVEIDEIGNKDFGYIWLPNVDSFNEVPTYTFIAEYEGDYNFDVAIELSRTDIGYLATTLFGDDFVKVYIQVNDGNIIEFTKTHNNVGMGDSSTTHSVNETFHLLPTDVVRIYGDYQPISNTMTASQEIVIYGSTTNIYPSNNPAANETPPSGRAIPTYIRITAETVYPQSDAQAYLIHDAANAVTDRIIGRANTFYSEYFGSTVTNGRTYSNDGCGWKNVLLPGLQIRGYTFDDKQFALSFKKWWEGANPIFNLGLGYDTISSQEVIRVESKSYFYDPTSISLLISNIRTISREYDSSRIFNKVEVGYDRWQSEDISGIDDPQSKRVYATRIQKINNSITLHSDFIAASYAIEVTRRQKITESKDYKYDNEVFIVAINGDDVSPDRYRPELDENFTSVTNLLNSETRYNLYLTPVYNLLRWQDYLNGCLQKYLSSKYKFVSGDGNYSMTSDTSHVCHGFNNLGQLSESQDVSIVRGFIHYPLLYTIEVINFTWDDYLAIRNNRHKAIAISQTLDNYKRFFIKDLTYDVCKGKAKIVAWPYDESPIRVIDTDIPEDEFENPVPEDCGDRVRLLEDGDERITEEEECRNLEDGGTKFFYHVAEGQPAEYIYHRAEIPPAETDYFYNTDEL